MSSYLKPGSPLPKICAVSGVAAVQIPNHICTYSSSTWRGSVSHVILETEEEAKIEVRKQPIFDSTEEISNKHLTTENAAWEDFISPPLHALKLNILF
jgi:hypothetical protein